MAHDATSPMKVSIAELRSRFQSSTQPTSAGNSGASTASSSTPDTGKRQPLRSNTNNNTSATASSSSNGLGGRVPAASHAATARLQSPSSSPAKVPPSQMQQAKSAVGHVLGAGKPPPPARNGLVVASKVAPPSSQSSQASTTPSSLSAARNNNTGSSSSNNSTRSVSPNVQLSTFAPLQPPSAAPPPPAPPTPPDRERSLSPEVRSRLHSGSSPAIRPNQSHLSSLISEIQNQQLQQQLKSTKDTASHATTSPPATPWRHRATVQSPVISPATATTTTTTTKEQSPTLGRRPPVFGTGTANNNGTGSPKSRRSSFVASPAAAAQSSLLSSSQHSPGKQWRLRALPSVAELGAAPARPARPPHVLVPLCVRPTPPLPQRNPVRSESVPSMAGTASSDKSGKPLPALPCNRPTPPTPPPCNGTFSSGDNNRRSTGSASPIPEYTAEEELGMNSEDEDELYDDTRPQRFGGGSSSGGGSCRLSTAGSINSNHHLHHHDSESELYQDAVNQTPVTEDFYEDVGFNDDRSSCSEQGSVTYGGGRGSSNKCEEAQRRKEDKAAKKLAKEAEKTRKRFNLTGTEEVRYRGVVRESVKAGRRRDELTVGAGDVVDIVRVEGNPAGKWLARNAHGHVGYVSLTNIEVDPNSLKRVMTPTRMPAGAHISEDDYIYDEGDSEAIYEAI